MRPLWLLAIVFASAVGLAQEPAAKPEVRVTYLNVCAPSPEEKQALAAALGSIPQRVRFAADFEVARGRSTMPDAPVSSWVRIRRELTEGMLSSVQYSISVDENSIAETLVFRVRDPKDVLMLSIQDTVSAGADIASVLALNTPANHVKIERYGKSSVALARCPKADQSALEPLFRQASDIMARYRVMLRVRSTVPGDLARLGVGARKAAPAKSAAPPPKSNNP
ncbi:MAG TPA: hypothetical protein VLE48_09890 [Terriglobales bacterium]|nr:hypothetical protein [Terriglobales bacterium]